MRGSASPDLFLELVETSRWRVSQCDDLGRTGDANTTDWLGRLACNSRHRSQSPSQDLNLSHLSRASSRAYSAHLKQNLHLPNSTNTTLPSGNSKKGTAFIVCQYVWREVKAATATKRHATQSGGVTRTGFKRGKIRCVMCWHVVDVSFMGDS